MSLGNSTRLIGVLLAAGRGRRMNGAKQFEPWHTSNGTLPLVAASFETIVPICDEMIVVLGHRVSEVSELLETREYTRVESDPDAPMFNSIFSGLQAAQELDGNASVLLQLGDHPEVACTTLESLKQSALETSEVAVMPEYEGRGGHPVLIPPAVVQRILSTDCSRGLKQFWRENPWLCHRIEVDDPGVIQDIDYPWNSQR